MNPFLLIAGKNNGEETEKLRKELTEKIEAIEKNCNQKLEKFDVSLFGTNRTFMSRLEAIQASVDEIGPDIFKKIKEMEQTFREMKRDNEIFKTNTKIDCEEL